MTPFVILAVPKNMRRPEDYRLFERLGGATPDLNEDFNLFADSVRACFENALM